MSVAKPNETYHAVISAGTFALGVQLQADALSELVFLAPQPDWQSPTLAKAEAKLVAETRRQVLAYLKRPDFDFDLPLLPQGTEHQRRVWQQIADIPTGEVTSYGEIARCIGSAPRAVGQACGANPYPVVVPCHRVVSAVLDTSGQNGLGGFARERGGFLLDVKRWLLQHEGVLATATAA